VTNRASNGWLLKDAPLGAAFGEYSEQRQMHPLYTLHQIRCKRPDLSQVGNYALPTTISSLLSPCTWRRRRKIKYTLRSIWCVPHHTIGWI